MPTSIILAVFIASELWAAWKALKKPGSTAFHVFGAALTAVVIIFLGHALPWYTSVHFYWWYALVGSFALHVGAITWGATSLHADRT
ncbi:MULTISPECIES: hypothetical protein [Corynebacterium]|jgi:hypothetical protein|uniref:hypothetical protein n=1 Tax=Corynebacterium TaxID=1716 RepID=UPI0003B7E62C|nr:MULTISPECIES: hypothetical protein [Corynebacterium]ERS42562.1 hypothetical protein HMPREF1293_01155 [Corynebacterium sp. KPL1996]ERS45894.1 hypothetical protein HMPREF1287_00331 [Corynebacterium sp. KPL1986]ERS70287.1 hypothetical protein HMPREF1300_01963 [Corynebacterium sp. KPL2004]ERS70544.1 hypothetical protein HMPREF1295_01764 [Corynebacterium sp. KPL1998]MCT1409198.1 hypothetical protein [Corynebacterium accolens]